MARPKTSKGQKKKLDAVFSEYIRRRDSDKNGYATCCTCGKRQNWKEMDAGHFVGRRILSLRYNEKNVNAQCRSCNRFNEGKGAEYAQFLIGKYGQGVIDELLGQKQKLVKIHMTDYENMIETYRQKIRDIGKEQCPYCCDMYQSVNKHLASSDCS